MKERGYRQQHNYNRGFTPLSKMDKSSKLNVNKDIVALNNVLYEIDLTNIYRIFHPEKESTHTFQMHIEHFQTQTE